MRGSTCKWHFSTFFFFLFRSTSIATLGACVCVYGEDKEASHAPIVYAFARYVRAQQQIL